MTFEEFILHYAHIKYQLEAKIGEFDAPQNCYGLVYWYYKIFRNIDMDKEVYGFDNIHKVAYNKVDVPEDGDIVILRTTDGYNYYHVGICVADTIYHFTDAGILSKSRFRMSNWIKGYYHVSSLT